MKKHQTTAILMGVLFFSAACGNNHQAREEALEQRIARLEQERYVPGFGEFMNAIQLHHAKLWFAGQQGNWPLAAYETDEMEEVLANLKKNVKDRPEIRQLPMIQPALDSMEQAVASKNPGRFRAAYVSLTKACNSCHQATDHGFNIIQIPTQPPVTDQQFGNGHP